MSIYASDQFQRCSSPPLPPGNCGAFAPVVSPGGGAFAVLSWPQGLSVSIPQGDPRAFDTHVFERQIYKFIEKDEAFVKDWLVHPGKKNLSMFLKVCFLNFRYFFITCKHINISVKVNYILLITKQSLT